MAQIPDDIRSLASQLAARLVEFLLTDLQERVPAAIAEDINKLVGDKLMPVFLALLDPALRATVKQNALIEFLSEKKQIDPAAFAKSFEIYEREHLGTLRRELLGIVSRELELRRQPPSPPPPAS